MTKIVLAFPCIGKTYYAQNHPGTALDLESSDYLFDRTGYEHLTSEEFKGIPNRKPKENGIAEYVNAIDEAVNSGKYDYIFTAQNPDIVHGILALGYDVHYLKPLPTTKSETVFKQRAKARGNNDRWIDNVIKFIKQSPLALFSDEELEHVYIHLVPSESYVTDVIDNGIL